jgi:hypothetical protein
MEPGGDSITSDHETGRAVVRSTSDPIHNIGTAIYLSSDVFGWAAAWGWPDPFAFYFAGRGGMLGDVPPEVVVSAMGWFQPEVAGAMFEEGVKEKSASEAAARMAEAHAKWGDLHYAGIDGLEEKVAVCEELVGGLEGSAIPIFVGFRQADPSKSPAGRAAQLMQILREWRGGLHLVGTTAVGLSPLEAILTNEGRGQAKFLGWQEPFPDVEILKTKHDEAEEITDRLCTAGLVAALREDRFGEFEAAVSAFRAATP